MKKQSSFKMKGFSGFGVSPAKNVLDTKIGDIPKKAKKAIKTGIDKFKNTTIRDVMRINPVYRVFDNRRRKKMTKKVSELPFDNVPRGAKALFTNQRGLKAKRLVRQIQQKRDKEEITKMKTIPVQKVPVKPKMTFNKFSN